MKAHVFRRSVLSLALAPGLTFALGLGEISLQSRIGEPFRAEVPIIGSLGQALDSGCFSLAQKRDADLPVVANIRTRLLKDKNGYRLLLSGTQPISDPIFMVSLRAGCNIDVQRDYILMPEPPVMVANPLPPATPLEPVTVARPPLRKGNFRELSVQDGETLESIASAQNAATPAERERILAAIQRANPDFLPDEPLTAGTTVRIPPAKRTAPAIPKPERAQPSATQPRPPNSSNKTIEAAPKAKITEVPTKTPDRVVLGSAPPEIGSGPKPNPHGSIPEMEERILKLESTLGLLNQEVEKLNTALALATEMLAVQQKIQNAQAMAPAPTVAATPPAPTVRSEPSLGNWLELILSAMLGAGLVGGLAYTLNRRNKQQINESRNRLQPDDFSSRKPSHTIAPPPAVTAVEGAVMPPRSSDIDIPLENAGTRAAAGQDSVKFADVGTDDISVLELAEIMVSFGRTQGALDTLIAHIETHPGKNVQPWLMLLDLYRRCEMRDDFDKLAERIASRFNIALPSWSRGTAGSSLLKSIEDYPHIMNRIMLLWGQQACHDYLYELVQDNRSGERVGFPLEVFEEIALLIRILESAHGLGVPE